MLLHRSVLIWFAICVVLVLLMIVIGAITRLTDSGLSMIEWRPILGFLPPLDDAEWQRVFALYKKIPEYRFQNYGMDIEGFKSIFWWEYFHRLWGRIIGIVYAVPLAIFWWRGMLPKAWKPALVVLLFLGGFQGVIGWWMVKSGLSQNLDVSAFRLMVHLGMALLILSGLWFFLLEAFQKNANVSRETIGQYTLKMPIYTALWVLVLISILSGALVAGNDAGTVYNDWPMMNGSFVPTEYLGKSFASWFDHQATVQFHHRMLAYGLFAFVVFLNIRVWRLPSVERGGLRAIFLVICIQIGLGIATLFSTVHTALAIAHHVNAVVLLLVTTTVCFYRLYDLRLSKASLIRSNSSRLV